MPIAPAVHRRTSPGKVHGQEYNRQQTRGLHTGSKRWRAIRREVLARDLYLCRDCGKFGDEVDHIDGDSHNHDPGNLQTLCKPCHARKTAAEMGHGVLLPKIRRPPAIPVVVVAGPPGSGKTTYARKHAGPRDIILDLDEVAAGIAGVHPHETPDDKDLMWRALAERNRRLFALADNPDAERCWFVVMAPRLAERRHWRDQLNASVVVIEARPDECLRRIAADKTRQGKPREFWERIVGQWWSRYTAEAMGAEETVIRG